MIFLDAADEADAKEALTLGFVSGITTNPKLMAATGRDALEQLQILWTTFPRVPIYYQPTAVDVTRAARELELASAIAGERLIAKLPAQAPMYGLARELVATGTACAITGMYSAAQAVVAAAVGAQWVIPYVDRSHRLRPGTNVVRLIADALRAVKADTRILAASIKSTEQAVQALLDGASVISAPIGVLRELPSDIYTDEAVEEFRVATEAAVSRRQ